MSLSAVHRCTKPGDTTPWIMRSTGEVSHAGPGDQHSLIRSYEKGNGEDRRFPSAWRITRSRNVVNTAAVKRSVNTVNHNAPREATADLWGATSHTHGRRAAPPTTSARTCPIWPEPAGLHDPRFGSQHLIQIPVVQSQICQASTFVVDKRNRGCRTVTAQSVSLWCGRGWICYSKHLVGDGVMVGASVRRDDQGRKVSHKVQS